MYSPPEGPLNVTVREPEPLNAWFKREYRKLSSKKDMLRLKHSPARFLH